MRIQNQAGVGPLADGGLESRDALVKLGREGRGRLYLDRIKVASDRDNFKLHLRSSRIDLCCVALARPAATAHRVDHWTTRWLALERRTW